MTKTEKRFEALKQLFYYSGYGMMFCLKRELTRVKRRKSLSKAELKHFEPLLISQADRVRKKVLGSISGDLKSQRYEK